MSIFQESENKYWVVDANGKGTKHYPTYLQAVQSLPVNLQSLFL